MKKHILFILFLSFSTIYSQVIDEIESKSSDNKSNHSSGNNNPSSNNRSSSNSYNNSSNSACSSCMDGCMVSLGLANMLENAQSKVIGRKDSTPEVISLEFYDELSAAVGESNFINHIRLRGNYGIISSEMRFYTLYSSHSRTGSRKYSLFDWQIIQLNLAATKFFKLRAGAGFTYEHFNQVVFFDWGISTDIYPMTNVRLRLDYRNNHDFETNVSPRVYFGGGIDYKIHSMRGNKVLFFLGLNANYTNFYQSVSLFSLGPTLNIRLQ